MRQSPDPFSHCRTTNAEPCRKIAFRRKTLTWEDEPKLDDAQYLLDRFLERVYGLDRVKLR
jgi:hypothetical protein